MVSDRRQHLAYPAKLFAETLTIFSRNKKRSLHEIDPCGKLWFSSHNLRKLLNRTYKFEALLHFTFSRIFYIRILKHPAKLANNCKNSAGTLFSNSGRISQLTGIRFNLYTRTLEIKVKMYIARLTHPSLSLSSYGFFLQKLLGEFLTLRGMSLLSSTA